MSPTVALAAEQIFLVPVEFYPCFVKAISMPASVARNRTFQVIYRAPVASAHVPEAWGVSVRLLLA